MNRPLYILVEGSCDNFFLMILGQCVEPYGITRYPYSQVRVFFRIFISVLKQVSVEDIYIEVMCSSVEISAEQSYECADPLISFFSEGCRSDGECVGNSVLAGIPVDLGY